MGINAFIYKIQPDDKVARIYHFPAFIDYIHAQNLNRIDQAEDYYSIDKDQLEQLLKILRSVNKENCASIFPCSEGQYDEGYFQDIDDLSEQITAIIANFKSEKERLLLNIQY